MRDCPFCGGETREAVEAPDYNWRVDRTVFHIRRCLACDFRYTADPPDDLGRFYTKNHYSRTEMAGAIERHAAAERYKLDIVRKHVQQGDLMEIGPSMGAFCKLSADAGFNVSAIEMDPACVAFINESLGLRAIQSTDAAEVLRREGRSYDVIAMWHALEHMARPWEVVAACAEWLRPGGILVVAVPNPQSRQARWMGGRWPHYDLPRHLSHMTPDWLTAVGEKQGLERLSLTTRDEGSLSVTTQSIPLWLLARTGASADRGGASRLLASLCWRLGRIAARAMAPWDAAEGEGAAYTIVFRK